MTTAVIIGFGSTHYFVDEDTSNVTLTVQVRGGTTQCQEREWTVHFSTAATSAQCKNKGTY